MKFSQIVSGLLCVWALALGGCGGASSTPATGTDTSVTSDATGSDALADGVGDSVSADAGDCCAQNGAQCGFIKQCTKSCGACSTGQSCDATHKCVAVVTTPLGKFGEPCGPNKDCPFPADTTDQTAMTTYFDCINGQCADGVCNDGVCTKQCTITTDDVNNATGVATPDGIEDPGATSDCTGAVDGVYGTKYSCVQLGAPTNPNSANYIYCVAESSFKPCKSNADCDAGDTCNLQLIYGAYQEMCSPAMKTAIGTIGSYTYKAGVGLGQPCNADPTKGAVANCANDFCSNGGDCLSFCNTDADCVTDPGACTGGKCHGGKACSTDADCSSFQCKPNTTISSNPAFSASLCLPRFCAVDGDCGAGSYCRPYWNGVKKVAGEPDPSDPTKTVYPAFQPECQVIAASAVKPGATCDEYATSANATKPGAVCQNPFACVDGSCGSLCKTTSDCAPDQQCGVEEIPLDVDNPQGTGQTDGIYDFELSLDICAYLPKAAGKCAGPKDCSGNASYCKAFVHKLDLPVDATPIGHDTVNGVCVAPDSKGGKDGDVCGPAGNDAYCDSGFCLNAQSSTGAAQPGFCGDYCGSKSDCPATISIGGTAYKNYCRSLRLGYNNTLNDIRDDLWLPVCYPIAATNSLDDCAATKKCNTAGEQCLPMTIAAGPDAAAKVEFLCASPGTTATKGVGEACTANPAATADPECKSGLGCMPDAAGAGYCTALCAKDADCGSGNDGLICDLQNQWLPRVDVTKAAIVPICKKAKSCVPCSLDGDCAGSYACSNLAASGATADGRCAPTCAVDADCSGKDGGVKCVPAVGIDGKPTGKNVCVPAACK